MQIQILKHERVSLLKKAVKLKKIKLHFMDLETSIMKVATHYIGNKVSIYHNQILKDKQIITIQYMNEGDKTAKYLKWNQNGLDHDDSSMIEEYITNQLNQPNIVVVGQNHKQFDHKVLNDRAKNLQLTPVEDVLKIDTLQLSRGSFRSASHKLDYRSKELGLGGKIKMEFQDWIDVENNDKKAMNKMIKYGLKDVLDLRRIFWLELPYYETLPAKLNSILREVKLLIDKKTKLKKHCCQNCRNKHRPSKEILYNIKKTGYLCKNCKQFTRIRSE